MVFEKIQTEGRGNDVEQLVFCKDDRVGLKAIIAMHSTVLGPATGGCRMWAYENETAALEDVLRLSKGMTYKASLAGLNWGGGKAVIIGNSKTQKSRAMLERYGEFVERLGGHYITAKDVGIGSEDLAIVKTKSRHVLGIDGEKGSSGDPSPATAWGVYHGMRAAVKKAYGADTMKGLRVALQGLGSVSYYLMEHLAADGATLVGCDIDQTAIERAVKKYGIEIVRPEAIFDVPCDVFAPSALGGAINTQTLPRLRTKVIAGAANNQLATPEMGLAVMSKGMLYAPDYAINAGGLMNIYHESPAYPDGYSKQRAFDHVAQIGQTMKTIFDRAEAEGLPTSIVADRMAEERVEKARKSS